MFTGTSLSVGKEGMPCPGKRSEVGGALFAVFALRSFSEGGLGTNFIEPYGCRAESPDMRSIVRGTSFIGAENLSLVTKDGGGHWRSVTVQFVSEPKNCHGSGI